MSVYTKNAHNYFKFFLIPEIHQTFKCPQCTMSFDNVADFNIHSNTHEDIDKYKCDKCDKTFSKLKNLKLHEYCHVNSRQYNCEICQKDFKHFNSLRFHIRSCHPSKTK